MIPKTAVSSPQRYANLTKAEVYSGVKGGKILAVFIYRHHLQRNWKEKSDWKCVSQHRGCNCRVITRNISGDYFIVKAS